MISDLESKNERLKRDSKKEAAKLERAVKLEKERNKAWSTIKSYEEKLSALTYEQNTSMATNSSLKREATLAKEKYE